MTLAGAIVMVLGGIGAMVVQVINAWYAGKERAVAKIQREVLMQKADRTIQKTEDAAQKAATAAIKTEEAHVKLDSIKQTTEAAAKDVNGNLHEVRDELRKSMELNKALQATVQASHETIQSLAEIVKQQRTQVRASDLKSPTPPGIDELPIQK